MKPRYSGHTGPVCRITIEGDRVHSTSNDKTLRVWDRDSGECLRIVETYKHIPYHEADEQYLYVITWATLSVYDTLDWSKVSELHLPTSQDLQGIAQDKNRIYIPARDGKLFVVGKSSLQVEKEMQIEGSAWAIASDEDHLYLGTLTGTITVLDKASLSPVRTLDGHSANIQRLETDENYVYSLSADRDLCVWNGHDGTFVKRLPKVFKRSMIGMKADSKCVYLANAGEGLKVLHKDDWTLIAAWPELKVPYGKGMAVHDGILYLGLSDYCIAAFPAEDLWPRSP